MSNPMPPVLVSTAYQPSPANPERWHAAWVSSAYFDAVRLAGGLPLLLPPLDSSGEVAAALPCGRALVLTGGPDLDPSAWGEPVHPAAKPMHPRRNASDLKLAAAAWERRMPILAICGGMQAVNVALGGSLYQHLPDAFPGLPESESSQRLPDDHTHGACVEPGSRLARILGSQHVEVNSAHHQAVRRVARGLRVVAKSDAGVIEALEPEDPERVAILVQWHPERLAIVPRCADRGNPPLRGRGDQLALFEELVDAARRYQPSPSTSAME
jgi:putative glutamine amidotransferase